MFLEWSTYSSVLPSVNTVDTVFAPVGIHLITSSLESMITAMISCYSGHHQGLGPRKLWAKWDVCCKSLSLNPAVSLTTRKAIGLMVPKVNFTTAPAVFASLLKMR